MLFDAFFIVLYNTLQYRAFRLLYLWCSDLQHGVRMDRRKSRTTCILMLINNLSAFIILYLYLVICEFTHYKSPTQAVCITWVVRYLKEIKPSFEHAHIINIFAYQC